MDHALLLLTGIAMLLGGGTMLVQGASRIASGFGVSPMIVGLTVVSFGTSSPELVAGGMLGLAIGGHLTITHGALLAEQIGLSKTTVGLVIVALGTSLPELITSLIAALRNESDISVGNVVGSNIFNSLLVLPVGAIIAPVYVPAGGVIDLIVSLLFAAALIPIFVIGNAVMARRSGAAFLIVYLAYMTYRTLSTS